MSQFCLDKLKQGLDTRVSPLRQSWEKATRPSAACLGHRISVQSLTESPKSNVWAVLLNLRERAWSLDFMGTSVLECVEWGILFSSVVIRERSYSHTHQFVGESVMRPCAKLTVFTHYLACKRQVSSHKAWVVFQVCEKHAFFISPIRIAGFLNDKKNLKTPWTE